MKRLLALSLLGPLLLISSNSTKADWNYYAISNNRSDGTKVYTVNSSDGTATLRTTKCVLYHVQDGCHSLGVSLNPKNQKLFFKENADLGIKYHSYDIETDTWEEDISDWDTWKDSYSTTIERSLPIKRLDTGDIQIGGDTDDIDIVSDGLNIDGSAVITNNSDGSIQIGADGNDIDITAEGLNIDGNPLITKKDNGEIHIGKNSLITKEEDGVQKLYAQDEEGNAININVTEGTKLLIDGVEVQTGNTTQVTTNKNNISTNTSNISSNDTDISALQDLLSTKSGSTTTARIGDSTKNTLEIGGDTNPTTINQEGISVGGSNLIKKQSNGDIHIGKNSFVIGNDVLDGAHPIWAEDENGTKIPLNIYGSDLQINGVSVQGQINTNKSNIKNLGSGVAGSTALTAALSALPQTSKESKLSCGVGTGAYSSRYAVGFGCASKVNERVDVNAGGSYVFGGSKSYGGGTLDNGVVKAGFVFKLGELNTPTQISMKEKKEFKKEISVLKENNERIISQNKNLEIKNQAIIDQNKSLLARLDRLEKLALGETKSKDLAVYKLK